MKRSAMFGVALLVAVSLAVVARGSPAGAPGTAPGAEPAAAKVSLLFFWGVGCPHCEEARPLVDALAREQPRLVVEAIEVRKDPEGRRRFVETMKELGTTATGVPTFVVGREYVVGYAKGETDKQLRALVEKALRERCSSPTQRARGTALLQGP